MNTTHLIKPIRSAIDYNRVLVELEAIMNAPDADRDYDTFDVLSTLVHEYEEQNHPIDPPDPVDAILFRLEQQGLPKSALEKYLGSRHRVSEILNRRRPLSIAMIQALHSGLGISADILIRRSRISQNRKSRTGPKAPRHTPARRRT